MKRLFSLLLLCLWSAVAFAGDIATAKDLVAFAAACNAGQSIERWQNADGAVCLAADIDMAKEKKFAGIEQFGGVFDGCGHSLLNWRAQHGKAVGADDAADADLAIGIVGAVVD